MLKLTDKEKLECIQKRIDKLCALNELFFDSIQGIAGCECGDKYNYVCKNISTYIYEIYVLLGKFEDKDFNYDA